jgi:RNA polymerase sigma factor (sigma-70 family)
VRSVAPVNALTHFATTRWNLIQATQSSELGCSAHSALAQLCQIYWRPILTFICRHGHSGTDAQDLTQDFFVGIFEGRLLPAADARRGRFRSLLLKSLRNFLIDQNLKSHRQKRGGDIQFVPWEEWEAEAARQSATGFECSSPEVFFDLRWAQTIVEQALRQLREECESKGHRQLFEVLHNHLAADRTDISYAKLAATLSVPETSMKKLLHQFRTRYRTLLRAEVAKTVEDPADVDEEIRYLCAALCTETA